MARRTSKDRRLAHHPTASKALFLAHYNAGRFAQALALCRQLIAQGVKHPNVLADAAVCCVYLGQWADAASYAQKALALDPKNLSSLDALAHAKAGLRDWPACTQAGRGALELRAAQVANTAPFAAPLADGPQGASTDIIAFSLFGGNPKYCETAVLNCLEQPAIYPHWQCRFYVDASVPQAVRDRLVAAGGQVLVVTGAIAAWPAPMWRFAALDAPDARRVIFRDADSVISTREAGAVRDWIASGRKFHAMRDSGTHTELLLAGLWGATKGALPPMATMIADFLRTPVENAHFADQFFLRRYVWPFARQDLMQHDSLFGFMGGLPFPDGPRRDDFHVGYAEGSPVVRVTSALPDGSDVIWELTAKGGASDVICRYPAKISAGHLTTHLPARYARQVQSGDLIIRILPAP